MVRLPYFFSSFGKNQQEVALNCEYPTEENLISDGYLGMTKRLLNIRKLFAIPTRELYSETVSQLSDMAHGILISIFTF